MTDDLAERLIDAQVAFSKRQLLDPGLFHTFVTEEVDGALRDASGLTLGEVVTPQMIKDTAIKFAVNMPLEGSIPELVGEIAGRLYRHPVNDAVHLTDVLDTRTFDELADAIGDMDVVRRVVREVIDSPVTVDVCVEVVTHAVDSAVLQDRSASGRRAGAARRCPGTTGDAGAARHRNRGGETDQDRGGIRAPFGGEESDNALVGSAHELWRNRSDDSVGRFRELVTADDVEDFVVVIFEFWKSFRETEYFRTLLGEGVDHFFDKYGDTSLVDLISDLGVEREDLLVEEGMRFGLPIIAHLDERGLLDGILRRQFVPFYHSPEFRAVIDDL